MRIGDHLQRPATRARRTATSFAPQLLTREEVGNPAARPSVPRNAVQSIELAGTTDSQETSHFRPTIRHAFRGEASQASVADCQTVRRAKLYTRPRDVKPPSSVTPFEATFLLGLSWHNQSLGTPLISRAACNA